MNEFYSEYLSIRPNVCDKKIEEKNRQIAGRTFAVCYQKL